MYYHLLLWLTLKIPNLCISVYTLRVYPPVAHAYPFDKKENMPFVAIKYGQSYCKLLKINNLFVSNSNK